MILVNGVANAKIDPADRGFSYGDGVFRTMLVQDALNKNWYRQYAKLASDCARIGILCPAATLFEQDFEQLGVIENDGVIKIMVTRGVGQRGYNPYLSDSPTRVVSFTALPLQVPQYKTDGISARMCQLRLARQPLLAGIKHINRLENVLARGEWQDPDIMEGLLLDESGYVIGGTMTNLFAVNGQFLCTPDLSNSGIAGVTRERILGFAERLGLTTKIEHLTLADLYAADEIMLCNSVIGIWQVRKLEHKQWQNGRYVTLFRSLLDTDND